jgi:cobalt/nickel transport protein
MSKNVAWWFIASIGIAGFLSLLASSHPDGFEKAGEEMGYIERAANVLSSPLPDYAVPGMESWLSTSIAGVVGVVLTFAAFLALSRVLVRKEER